jgi:hypothetical protein
MSRLRFVLVQLQPFGACRSRTLALRAALALASLVGAALFCSSAAAASRCGAQARSQAHARKGCAKARPRKCRAAHRRKPQACRVGKPTNRRPPKRRPAPPRIPSEPPGYIAPSGLVSPKTPTTTTSATPPQARTWGAGGKSKTLVVYDSTNTWGYLGAVYGTDAGNVAAQFGQVTAEPVVDYIAGQLNGYTATIYIGSTYDEPIPTAFLNDVLTTTRPVIWAGYNVWQLSGTRGSAANTAFISKYGWDPSTSYIDTTDDPTSVSFGTQVFTRDPRNGANLVAPHITNAAAVTVLARANCTSSTAADCAPIAQSTGTTFPWAIRSANLTHIGEEPFSYTSATDRSAIFSALVSATLG